MRKRRGSFAGEYRILIKKMECSPPSLLTKVVDEKGGRSLGG
jgi:hypothetical protein